MRRRKPLHRRQRAEHLASPGKRERDLVEPDSRDLLDEIDLPRHVARAPGGNGDAVVLGLEPEALQDRALLLRRGLEADQRVGAVGPQSNRRSLRERAMNIGVTGPARAADLDEQLRRKCGRLRRQVRVDALLPAIRAFRAELQPLRGPQQPDRLEVRSLEQDLGRRVSDLGLLAAHDPCQRDRLPPVGDHEVVGCPVAAPSPSSVRSVSPSCARRTRIRSSASVDRSNA